MTEIAVYTEIDSATGFGPQALRDILAEAGGEPVKVRLNSEGGNVIDGLACHNLLQGYSGETTVVIDGMALSIASLLACGADRVQMAENAWFMIHNPHNQAVGDGEDLRNMASLLDGMRDQLASVYSAKSKKPKEEILQLMDAETWMTGPQALEAGFVDEVTASLEVAATFDASRFSKPPTIHKEKEPVMAAATFSELKAAFPRASADFVVTCQEKGYTLDKARAEHDEENAKALDESAKALADSEAQFEEFKKNTEEEAKAKAEEDEKKEAEAKAAGDEVKKAEKAKAKSGVLPAASGKAKGGRGASAFHSGVDERIDRGMSKAQAVAETVHDDPEAHKEFVQAANVGRSRRRD